METHTSLTIRNLEKFSLFSFLNFPFLPLQSVYPCGTFLTMLKFCQRSGNFPNSCQALLLFCLWSYLPQICIWGELPDGFSCTTRAKIIHIAHFCASHHLSGSHCNSL